MEPCYTKKDSDRFIPSSVSTYRMELRQIPCPENKNSYNKLLQQQLLIKSGQPNQQESRILNFRRKTNRTKKNHIEGKARTVKQTLPPKILHKPYKVLQAPGMQDDYYYDLIDWSRENQLAVGLDSSVFIWKSYLTKVQHIYESPSMDDIICSTKFGSNPSILSFGTSQGTIKLFDVNKSTQIVQFEEPECGRVGSISWENGLMAAGTKNGTVIVRDIRCKTQSFRFSAHYQQICGLKWSPDGNMISSGGNDNKLSIWSLKAGKNLVQFSQHKAAVKAIGWRSSQILASGGGAADQHIRIFSTHQLKQKNAVNTGSQVCNLLFSPISNEMVSTHGYALNEINVWSFNSEGKNDIERKQTLTGHAYRVLYLAGSPDGSSIVTGAGDETLKFWKVFNQSRAKHSTLQTTHIELR